MRRIEWTKGAEASPDAGYGTVVLVTRHSRIGVMLLFKNLFLAGQIGGPEGGGAPYRPKMGCSARMVGSSRSAAAA
jgi:hypothetical protein